MTSVRTGEVSWSNDSHQSSMTQNSDMILLYGLAGTLFMLSSLQDPGLQLLPPGTLSVSWQRGKRKWWTRCLLPHSSFIKPSHVATPTHRGQSSIVLLCAGRRETGEPSEDIKATTYAHLQFLSELSYEAFENPQKDVRLLLQLLPQTTKHHLRMLRRVFCPNEENLILNPWPLAWHLHAV